MLQSLCLEKCPRNRLNKWWDVVILTEVLKNLWVVHFQLSRWRQKTTDTFFSCICQSQPKTVSAFGLIYGLLKNTNNFTIGSSNFCNTFLMKAISKAKDATHKIINGLSDLQTKLCLFSVCTVHKLTHLFAYDLYTNCSNGLPNNWFCWDGAFNGEFTEMINIIFENITQTSGMPHTHN